SVDRTANELLDRILQLTNETIDSYSLPFSVNTEDILINDGYLGEGYGVPTQADIQAIIDFARYEGILLDPVYTGRAAAGLIDLVKSGVIPSDASVLFWHTGGSPALFAEAYEKLFTAME
ncbi:MAG: pyridoxal-phosphate dependent enzyme, partial [Anaerolineales bacterium]|nr:pyridoxal-phosphate dependent enzyme [Anaerolineales bacterium]